jgi:hypothetical protein
VSAVVSTPGEPAAATAPAAPAPQRATATRAQEARESARAAGPSVNPLAAPKDAGPAPRSGSSRGAAAPRSATSPALADELAALDRARTALASGDSRRALTLLEGYGRSYPRGRLQLEAEVLRIDALARAGQREAARRRAEAFLRRQPNSVLASRVRSYL